MKVPARKEKESATTVILPMEEVRRRIYIKFKKVLLTSLGDEARFSLFALAVGISESCSQILRFP